MPMVYVTSSDNIDNLDIDSDNHECVILEHQFLNDEESFFDKCTFDGKEYELRAIVSINHDDNSMTKYTGCLFSRHGGYHSKWWAQTRNNNRSIPYQIDGKPQLPSGAESIFVYVKSKDISVQKYSRDILQYIGGQTHAICNTHSLPMIPVPDRIAICSRCERKEVLQFPELGCNNCLCRKCFDALDKSIVNGIEPKTLDEVESSENDTSTANEDLEEDEDDENIFDDHESVESDSISSDYLCDKTKNQVDRDDMENFVTNGAMDIDYDSDHSYQEDNDGSEIGDFDVTTDAGDIPFEIEEEEDLKQTRGMNISGHVILNFVGSLLTRK